MLKKAQYISLIAFVAFWLTLNQVLASNGVGELYARWLGVSFVLTSFVNVIFLVALLLVFRAKISNQERLYWPLVVTLTGWLDNLISYTRFSAIPDYWILPFGIITNASDLLIWVGLIWLFVILFIWKQPALPNLQTPEVL